MNFFSSASFQQSIYGGFADFKTRCGKSPQPIPQGLKPVGSRAVTSSLAPTPPAKNFL
jgi:hypothetical protein